MTKTTFKPIPPRGHNGFDPKENSDERGSIGPFPQGLTTEEFREDSDINVILRRYGVTGQLPLSAKKPIWGEDWTTAPRNYQDSLNQIMAAQNQFMELHPELRARFHNNPQELLDFISDDRNMPEAQKLGLVKEKPKDANNTGTTGATAQATGGGSAPNQAATGGN